MIRQNGGAIGRAEQIDEPPHDEIQRGLDRAGEHRDDEQGCQRSADRAQVEPREAEHRARRHLGFVKGRERIDAALEPIEEHAAWGVTLREPLM